MSQHKKKFADVERNCPKMAANNKCEVNATLYMYVSVSSPSLLLSRTLQLTNDHSRSPEKSKKGLPWLETVTRGIDINKQCSDGSTRRRHHRHPKRDLEAIPRRRTRHSTKRMETTKRRIPTDPVVVLSLLVAAVTSTAHPPAHHRVGSAMSFLGSSCSFSLRAACVIRRVTSDDK